MAVWDNVALTPRTGAYHSSEIPIALGTNALRPNSTPDTDEEAKLSSAMVHAWAEFAKEPTAGLANLGWPQYNPWGNTLILLGDKNLSALAVGPSAQFDALCDRQAQPAPSANNTTAAGTGALTSVSGGYANSPAVALLVCFACIALIL